MTPNAKFGWRRLARRPLPMDDSTVDALDPAARQAVATMWERRSEAELRVAATFAVVARDLFVAGADPEVLAVAARTVGDEVRHAEICRRVASRYAGRPVAWPNPGPTLVPDHPDASPELRCALHMLGMCCLNETIASAFLQACFERSKAPLARAAFAELLADEIDHARVGWAYLASSRISDPMRKEIGARFRPFRDASVHVWTTQNRSLLAGGIGSHGLLSDETVEALVVETIDHVVVPGLATVGIGSG